MLTASMSASGQAGDIEFNYLGTAGWEIKSGGLVILVDPFISGLKYGLERSIAEREKSRSLWMADRPVPDTALIDKVLTKADFILVHHSHVDHILDVPHIAKKTGAKVIGTETTRNMLRAQGVPDAQLHAVRGGEDYQFEGLSIRVIPSLHTAFEDKKYFDSRRHGPEVKLPLQRADFIEGGTLMYLIRVGGYEVLTMGSMNFIERELQGLKPDILIAGVTNSRRHIYEYTNRLLAATGSPKIVMPSHWDISPLYRNEAAYQQERTEVLGPFVKEVASAAPASKVILPIHLRPIAISGGRVEE
ncbi:MAG: MBL fold metallo-hydrolase [Steroidobacter sp.]|nr:MBL fold metallo-hydrolase [Steroidobacter sp.]